MKDTAKAREQLVRELDELRRRVAELEAAEAARRRAESALCAERDRIQQYLDVAGVMFVALNEQGEITLINEKGCSILEYDEGELVGQNWFDTCLPPHIRETVRQVFCQLMAGETEPTEHYENPVLTKSGKEKIIVWHNTMLTDEAGGIVGTLSSGLDVTAHRRAEAERDRLFNLSVDMLCVAGLDGFFKQLNPAWHKTLGWTEEELTSKPWLDFVHPEDYQTTVQAGEQLQAGQTVLVFENRYRCKDGSYRWLSWNSFPVPDANLIFGVARDITAQKQAEAALQKSEERFRSLYAAMNEGMALHEVIYDESGEAVDYRILEVNPSYETITGLKRTQAVGSKASELYKADSPPYLEIYAEVAASGKPVLFEANFPLNKYFRISVFSPGRGQFATIFTDITKRRRAEAAEREQRTLAEALRDTAAVLNSTLDLDRVLDRILANVRRVAPHDGANIMFVEGDVAHVVRTTGYHVEHGLKGAVLALRFPFAQASNLRQMAESGQPFVVEDTRNYDGWVDTPETRWVRSYAGAPILRDEELIGFINLDSAEPDTFTQEHAGQLRVFADQAAIAIKNARLYQELEMYSQSLEALVDARTAALRQTTERVEAILDSSPDAILILTDDGAIDTFNRAFCELFGYTPDEIFKQTPAALVEDAYIEAFDGLLRSALNGKPAARLEMVALRKDGESFDADVAFAPVQEEGVVIGAVCSIRDISALKEVERMKDAFVSNVSHELRTPITSIKLYHQLLIHNPEKYEVYMDRLQRETERLVNIVEDLLHLSRLDQGRVTLTFAPTDLNALIDQYVTDRLPIAESRALNLVVAKQPGVPTVLADQNLLGQVLSILLTNALNYTPAGGAIMVSTQTRCLAEQPWVGFEVCDTGPGIPPDEQAQLFKRFFRGTSGHESGRPGTGLGLAIAREIVERHHGQVEVSSEGIPGKGSAFTVWLPAHPDRRGGPA